jgi:phosphoglycolate phosphatase
MRDQLTAEIATGDSVVAHAGEALTAELGFRPASDVLRLSAAPPEPSVVLDDIAEYPEGVGVTPCRVAGIRAAIIQASPDTSRTQTTELIGPVSLRSLFDLAPGERVSLDLDGTVWPPSDRAVVADRLDAFDAVVFDLDRTLLTLDVDWGRARRAVEGLFESVPTEGSVWGRTHHDLGVLAREHDRYDDLLDTLREAELERADRPTRLPAFDVLDKLTCPIGVCTANAVSAAERALDAVEAFDTIDVIVGRETVFEGKPHPKPLQVCLDRLSTNYGNSVFVGDSDTDAEAARRGGTSFLHPDQLR